MIRKLADSSFDQRSDCQQMLAVLARFPEQCRAALAIGAAFELPQIGEINKIVICAMGGSALAGEVVKRFATVPVFVHRNYSLPSYVDELTLLIAVSYSGNTAETLSALNTGLKRRIAVLCLSSGGALKEIAQRESLPYLQIPAGYQPRAAVGYLSLSLIRLLSQSGVVAGVDRLDSLADELTQIDTRCNPTRAIAENPAKKMAAKLAGKIPLIYGTQDNTEVVALRWKAQINENAKQPAFWNLFPELNHNEIEGLIKRDLLPNQEILLLRNDYDRAENIARIEIMKTLFGNYGISFTEINASGETEIGQIFSQIYLGDYVSVYLGLLNGVDPTPVPLIEEFKQLLAKDLKR
ncbi:bifunctional phosphoglucose/phosphomannose isomerase [Candidatus Acetothermia bacterium]|jgi:glucose/mannose-6-phosphate isomerase|nr:bifunctional phosphoglucose/phosphomannose isomerase [Candidatus Acetothermia bacterium]MCI2427157.1 bifunctional phosphoglucose/phosphomannose isomerase [Candidatus Acetothermia bacterium]MCI2428791.1 bifunctional phosphoglucose/phosphomannose isomerase [Candidatus Acetothermia bacterium]